MQTSFKIKVGDRDYTVYRASLMDNIVYYALFTENGERSSIKIDQTRGYWGVPSLVRPPVSQHLPEIIAAVQENEKSSVQALRIP